MNLIETFLFITGLALTIVVAYYLFDYIGWWGILPAPVVGFGSVMLFIVVLNRVIPDRRPNDKS